MIEFLFDVVVEDPSTGEKKEKQYSTGLSGELEDQFRKLAMEKSLVKARIEGKRLLKVKKIATVMETEVLPEDFPELINL